MRSNRLDPGYGAVITTYSLMLFANEKDKTLGLPCDLESHPMDATRGLKKEESEDNKIVPK